MIGDPPLHLLRTFDAAARNGSLTGAAWLPTCESHFGASTSAWHEALAALAVDIGT